MTRKKDAMTSRPFYANREMSTAAARAIRYTPKGMKVWFLTKDMRNFTVAVETRNAVTEETARTAVCSVVSETPEAANFAARSAGAPNITGIAMKKENSDEARRETPSADAPRMVEPERDVPGMSEST